MGLIFFLSTDLGSARHTVRFIEALPRRLDPDVTLKNTHQINILLRKAAHILEYVILAFLVGNAAAEMNGWEDRERFWKTMAGVMLFSVAYAVSDEFHQSFVPSRDACGRDVLIDSCGVLIGVSLLWCWRRFRIPDVQFEKSPAEQSPN